jgi:hypothetical protein
VSRLRRSAEGQRSGKSLHKSFATFPDQQYVNESQQYLSAHYADNGRKWGLQDAAAWQGYPQFIIEHGGVKDAKGNTVNSMNFNSLYTNQFLP